MDGQYGIAVTNKFLLLDDEEDILDTIHKQEEAKKLEKTKGTKTEKNKVKVVKKTINNVADKRNDNVKSGLEKSRNEKNVRFNNRENDGNRRGRGGFRGRGGRGRGGFESGFDRNGKRDFDRHSGNDKSGPNKTSSKREGLGSHNWGSTLDEINIDDNVTEEGKETNTKTFENGVEESEVPVESTPVEEGPNEISLVEYRALQNASNVDGAFKVRQAGEGVDNKQWKKSHVHVKANDGEDDEIEYEEEERSGRTKNLVDIEIRFSDQSRGRSNARGGSGAGGGGFRRGFRGGNNNGFRRSGTRSDEQSTEVDSEVKNETVNEQTNGGFGSNQNSSPAPRGRGGNRAGFRGGNRGGRGVFKSRVSVPNVSNEKDFPSLGA